MDLEEQTSESPETGENETPESGAKPEESGSTLLTAESENGQKSEETKQQEEPAKEPEDWKIDAVDGWSKEQVELLNRQGKAMGLTKDQAMKATEHFNAMHKQEQEQLAKRQKDWEAEIRSDPEFGGEKFVGSIETAKRALTTYDTDGTIRKMLNDTGYGSNPAVIRFFARIGRDVREDKVITSRGAQKAERPLEERIWKD